MTKLGTRRFLGAFFLIFTLSGCSRSKDDKSLWIYTSLYPETIKVIGEKMKVAFPAADIKWYQGGSENVATKLATELLAGKPRADIIMTSDPFWYEELKQKGLLLPYKPLRAERLNKKLVIDSDFHYVSSRIPFMVIAYRSDLIADDVAPRSLNDLIDPKKAENYRDKIAMGNPLESGTTFVAVSLLAKKFSWDYFERLRELNALSAGGNSAVMAKVESGERPIGIVLFDNAGAASMKNPKIKTVIPTDALVMVPSPAAILKSSQNSEIAKQFIDHFLNDEVQAVFADYNMFGVFDSVPAPKALNGELPNIVLPTKPFLVSNLMPLALPLGPEVIREIFPERELIKNKFSDIMLR